MSHRYTILIVDDNPNNLFTLRALLSRLAEIDVIEAGSGEAALVATLEHEIHLVMLDVQMPGMDGFETAQHLRMTARTRHIPIIFVTAVFKAAEFRERGYAVGAVDYLTKPIDDNLLLNRVSLYRQLFEREQRLKIIIETLRENEARLQLAGQVLETMPEGVMILDSQERIINANPVFCANSGYSKEQILGAKAGLLKSGRHDKAFFDDLRNQIRAEGQWQGEIWNRRANGEIFPEWLNATVIRDERGEIKYYVCIYSDLSSQEHIRHHLQHLAYHDVLTGLPNRELFQDRLLNAIATAHREKTMVGVMFIDLDRFKNINDTLGHSVGDGLLQQVAERITHSLRENDTVARLGGDEFTVILPACEHQDNLAKVAQKLIQVLTPAIQIDDNALHITASIGIGIYPHDGKDSETLLRNADAAMYSAKESGRNTFQFYTQEMTSHAMESFYLETDLRKALTEAQFELYYQPLVDLADGRVIGAEALIRWQHPAKGMIPPDKFIKVAESSGLIVAIDKWVMNQACGQFMAWSGRGCQLERIAVNISGFEITQGDLVATTQAAMERSGIEPQQLELEVSEGFILQQRDQRGIETLDRLRELGVWLAIDDFGTGYSSLSYLKRLPINRLKIDRSFVKDIPGDSDDTAIASAVIAMGKSLGLNVIAEGIETEQQRQVLVDEGCHEGQGYLFGRPLPAHEFEQLLLAHRGRADGKVLL